MNDRLAGELAGLARRLSAAQVRAWATVLELADRPGPAVEASLIDVQAGPGATGAAAQLVSAWRRWAPSLPGNAVALALATASEVHEDAERRRPRLVASGPTSDAAVVRLTSSVVVELVRAARERVLLVSFAAHGVTAVVDELDRALTRGVRVDLVLEHTTGRGGALVSGAGSGAFDRLAGRATVWHWPPGNRGAAGRAALHAKVVTADGRSALLSSANFTDRGFSANIELGVLLRDPEIVGQLEAHFRQLMRPESRCLSKVSPPA